MLFFPAIYKGIEGNDWEELYVHQRVLRSRVKVKNRGHFGG